MVRPSHEAGRHSGCRSTQLQATDFLGANPERISSAFLGRVMAYFAATGLRSLSPPD